MWCSSCASVFSNFSRLIFGSSEKNIAGSVSVSKTKVLSRGLITGSTPGAIKQRAHRAYVTLRQMLRGKELA